MSSSPRRGKVVIVGGGIAGLTAALRLSQVNWDVTLYEQGPLVGGNLGGQPDPHGVYHDVYPHMFGNWYLNFWRLVESLGLTREEQFEPRPTFAILREKEFPNYRLLTNNGSMATQWANLTNGFTTVPDMFLVAYSILDLLSQDFEKIDLLNEQSVNGFIVSRPYATKNLAAVHDMLIANIWSVNSYLTTAFAYQSFAKYQFRDPTPQCWVLKKDSQTTLIDPLLAKLKQLGCDVRTNANVKYVRVKQGRVQSLQVVENDEPVEVHPIDHLILAVSPQSLASLVLETDQNGATPSPHTHRSGNPIVSVLPQLSELRRLRSEPIPVFDVVFKHKLPNIPDYYVSLEDSLFAMTFVKVKWREDTTVLSVAISDFYSLPEFNVDLHRAPEFRHAIHKAAGGAVIFDEPSQKAAKYLILKELNRFVPFALGDKWGDPDSDVDWNRSYFHSNSKNLLFINESGSRNFCPDPWYENLENLYFAGDYCKNEITIATVESAVVSGLKAAEQLCENAGHKGAIKIEIPDSYPQGLMALGKVALAPYAAAAKCWSDLIVIQDRLRDGKGLQDAVKLPGNAVSVLAETATKATAVANEWWKTMRSLYGL